MARPTTNPTLRGVRTAEEIAENTKKFAPVKLEQVPESKDAGSNAKWNGAKTWEDRKLKAAALKPYLENAKVTVKTTDCELVLTKVLEIDGDASIAVIRGEPRMGYDLNLKL